MKQNENLVIEIVGEKIIFSEKYIKQYFSYIDNYIISCYFHGSLKDLFTEQLQL